MEAQGYSWILTDTHRYSWILTDTHGYSQILTDTHGYSQILTDTHGTVCPIGPKGKARTHCYVYDANFAVRVKLRRHIRSGPLKPAPATCFLSVYSLFFCIVFLTPHVAARSVAMKFGIRTFYYVHLTILPYR